MAIVVTPPEKIGFSKNDLPWVFEDDREGIVPGIQSETILSIDNPVLAGSQLIFRWGENDLRFTAADLPGLYGSEFPTYPVWDIATHETYVKSLVPYFAGNYFLQKDFTVQAHPVTISGTLGSVTLWTIKLTAPLAGTAFNLNKTVFSGGGLTPSVTGSNDSTVVNNSVYVEVWMQTADASMYQLKYNATQPFDESSTAVFDVSAVLHSNLASEIPDMVLPVAERCNQSRRKYYLRYALAGGQNLSIGTLQQTDDHVVLLGGFGQWKTGPQSLIDTFKKSNSVYKLLMLRPALRVVRQDEPVFVSWVNFGAAGRNIYARATVTFADGTELTTNTAVITGVLEYEKLIFGVGFKQLNLGYFNGTGRTVKEFTITIQDDLGAVSEPYRLVVNYAHLEYVRYFAHVNSYGSIDTLMTYGKGSSNWKVFKEQAQKVLPYNFQSTQAQFVDWNATYQDNQEVATGWMRKKELTLWLDLFISPLKYRIIKGSAYAVQVNSDTIQRGSDGDNQYGLIFEYQFARIFDSLDEQLLEGEDTQDYIPANVVLAGSLETSTGGGGGASPAPALRVDPYPISNSDNPVSSDGVFRALAGLQKKLPAGLATDFYNGQGLPRNLKTAVNAAETDPTVPSYAKSLNSLNVIFNGLQAMNPGLNVNLFGGQLAEWYLRKMAHPEFSEIPPIVVQQGVPFDKFVDLSIYKTSYHQSTDLTVSVKYNGAFWHGVDITKEEGLILRVKGELPKKFDAETQLLVTVKDDNGNSTIVGLRITVLEEEQPEQPDNRALCGKGPFHWLPTPIQIFNNGKIRVPFDADGVPQLRWKIVNADTDVESLRSGISPNDNGLAYFIAEFAPLPGKTYRLGIQGDLCKSPWVYRDLVLPVDNTLNWSTGFPKYEVGESSSEFLAMVDLTGQYLTELVNTSNNTTVYSQTHDYIADTTIVHVPKPGNWPDAIYRFNVGALSEIIKVGNPIEPPSFTFKLVEGYDGATIKDLALGPYVGKTPALGFNIFFQSNQLGFLWNYLRYRLYLQVAGVYQHVTTAGGEVSVGSGTSGTVLNPIRIFPLNVDSRLVNWNGKNLNSGGKYKVVYEFRNGGSSGAITGTKEQTFELLQLKIEGGWVNIPSSPGGRVTPVLSSVQYNGQNIFNNAGYIEPWLSAGLGDQTFQYSLDLVNWYGTALNFQTVGGVTTWRLYLPNVQPADHFPTGTNKTIYLRNGMDHSVISEPYQINQLGSVALLGTYETTSGGRRMTYQRSPGFVLSLHPTNGTLTDVTPGTVHGTNGELTTCNGKKVFYMLRYRYHCTNGDGNRAYKTLKDIYLPDFLYTISRFECNPSALPTWDAIKAGFGGWPPETGVNKYNAVMSQITLTLHTLSDPKIPLWLTISRKLNFLNYIPNRAISKKIFAIESLNRGDNPAAYWAKDVRTQTQFNPAVSQRYTFRTFKWPWDLHPGDPLFTDTDLYHSLRNVINAFDLGPESIITDEYPENAQGQDTNIGYRVGLAYKGAWERFQELFPTVKKIDTGLMGSYGGDRFYGLVDPGFLFRHPKARVAEYLSTKVHVTWNIDAGDWHVGVCAFYASDQHKYRNVNVDYYMYLGVALFNIPMELVFANERIKIGSKNYEGEDNECSWMVFGTILSQSLMRNELGQQIGPEEYRTGDIIPLPNGEVMSRYNTPIAANAGEHWDMGFWGCFIGRGTALWDGGGSYGQDPTKIFTYTPAEQYIRWTPTGGSEEPYISGNNGAPENSVEGMKDTLYSTVVDATMAGHQAALELEGYRNVLYFASYTSSRKTFVATPGDKGYHLNGFGELNMGSLTIKDAADQKAGTAIIGQGPSGRVAVYNNGFLSCDEYEENVTLTYGSWTVNLGRVYGGQTRYVKF